MSHARAARDRPSRQSGPLPGKYPVRFGTAELIRDADHADAWLLSVDGVAQSYVDLADPTNLEFDYVRRIGDVIDELPDGPLDVLHVGGAGCTLPRYIATTRPGSRQHVFDPDGELVALVRAQLGLKIPNLRVRVSDGRAGVASRRPVTADVVIADAFESGKLAGGLATVEFTTDVARVLRPAGVYVANISDGPGLPFARRYIATLAEVFGHVLLLAEPGVLRGRRYGNLVLAAARAELPADAVARRTASAPFPARCVTGAELRKLYGTAAPIRDDTPLAVPIPPMSWARSSRLP